MTTINLSAPVTTTSGNPMVDQEGRPVTLANILANILAGQSKGQALKVWAWALDLHKTNQLSVDDVDLKFIKDVIENSETTSILAKAQLLIAIG